MNYVVPPYKHDSRDSNELWSPRTSSDGIGDSCGAAAICLV